ncbi:MAG TPA: glycoside hydrolase family 31 protein [Prolixibacteraceae bacterium]|nr:glycoside hydrolase family 31 protein [Prolixibacteraceae bacterium]
MIRSILFFTGLFLIPLFPAAQPEPSSEQAKVALRIECPGGILTLAPWTENIVRVAFSPDGKVENTDAICMVPKEIRAVKEENTHHWIVKTDSLIVAIDKKTLQINFYNHRRQHIATHTGFFSDSLHSGFRFRIKAIEMIFGGGGRAIPMDRRGYRLNLNNEPHWGYGWGEENLNFSVPHFVSSSGYALFFDNGAIGYADVGKTVSNQLELAARGGNNSYFFMAHSTQNDLRKSFARLTGTQAMPPRWALGNLMSRFGYTTEQEAREKLDSMLASGYPVDAIILDLYWFGRGPDGWMMGDLDWYRPNWPTAEKMIADFQAKGVQTVLITEPYFLETSKNFPEADRRGLFAFDTAGQTNIVEDFWFGRAGLIDLFNPEACDWFWDFYRKQIENGVAGWWGDLGEPEKFHDDLVFQSGRGPEVKNLYGHYWSKMLSDYSEKFYPDKRLFHLNRAGFAGSQRYRSYPWSGDVSRTWGGFRAQLPILLSMSLSNISYAHSDLGGFCAEPMNEELYLRWLQFGVFNPVFRPHSEKVPSEPIYYSDSIQNMLKPFFELRYRLLPYNYTLAWQQEEFGKALAAPLFLKTSLPKKMWNRYDEYFWGDAFLVAPILEPGQTTREVFLPPGIWFDFFTGKRFLGNSLQRIEATPEWIPVFVKAGSFVPMTLPMKNTASYNPSELEIHYYYDPSVRKAEYVLYDDDGALAGSYAKNRFELITCTFLENDDRFCFSFTNHGNDYPGRPDERTLTLIIHYFPSNAFSEEVVRDNGNGRVLRTLRKNESIKLEILKSKTK